MSKVRIAFSPNFVDVSLMKQTCEENGIFVFEIPTVAHVSVAGADQGYYLQVKTEEAEKASEILKNEGFEKFVLGGSG